MWRSVPSVCRPRPPGVPGSCLSVRPRLGSSAVPGVSEKGHRHHSSRCSPSRDRKAVSRCCPAVIITARGGWKRGRAVKGKFLPRRPAGTTEVAGSAADAWRFVCSSRDCPGSGPTAGLLGRERCRPRRPFPAHGRSRTPVDPRRAQRRFSGGREQRGGSRDTQKVMKTTLRRARLHGGASLGVYKRGAEQAQGSFRAEPSCPGGGGCPALRGRGPPTPGPGPAKPRSDGPSPLVSKRTVCKDNETADLWLPG